MPEVLAPGVPSPAWGPWAPLGDGSGPARASSPGWVAGGLHVTRKVGTAVSAVWQYHLVVTVAAQEARTVPPMPQFTSRWRTAPSMGEGCSPPTPTLGADSSRRGQADLPQPPASTLGTTGAQRPEQSPFVQAGPLLPLGRCPNPSRNRTRLGSAFEPPQEGSAELLKADETPPPPPPLKQSRPSALRVQDPATLVTVLTLWGCPRLLLLSRRACCYPVPQFPHPKVEGPGRVLPCKDPTRCWSGGWTACPSVAQQR